MEVRVIAQAYLDDLLTRTAPGPAQNEPLNCQPSQWPDAPDAQNGLHDLLNANPRLTTKDNNLQPFCA
jgi:hypothetical protein